jgi:hypothetical protein
MSAIQLEGRGEMEGPSEFGRAAVLQIPMMPSLTFQQLEFWGHSNFVTLDYAIALGPSERHPAPL